MIYLWLQFGNDVLSYCRSIPDESWTGRATARTVSAAELSSSFPSFFFLGCPASVQCNAMGHNDSRSHPLASEIRNRKQSTPKQPHYQCWWAKNAALWGAAGMVLCLVQLKMNCSIVMNGREVERKPSEDNWTDYTGLRAGCGKK